MSWMDVRLNPDSKTTSSQRTSGLVRARSCCGTFPELMTCSLKERTVPSTSCVSFYQITFAAWIFTPILCFPVYGLAFCWFCSLFLFVVNLSSFELHRLFFLAPKFIYANGFLFCFLFCEQECFSWFVCFPKLLCVLGFPLFASPPSSL